MTTFKEGASKWWPYTVESWVDSTKKYNKLTEHNVSKLFKPLLSTATPSRNETVFKKERGIQTKPTWTYTQVLSISTWFIRSKRIGNALNHIRKAKGIGNHQPLQIGHTVGELIEIQIEWQPEIHASVCVVLLFLIGAPFGILLSVKGGLGLPLIIAVSFFPFIPHNFPNGEKLAKSNSLGREGKVDGTARLSPNRFLSDQYV